MDHFKRFRSCSFHASKTAGPRRDECFVLGYLLPAVWSFMLALRSPDLGGRSPHLRGDREKRVAEVLGIPFDSYAQSGRFPIGFARGSDFRPAKRSPVEQIVHWNRR